MGFPRVDPVSDRTSLFAARTRRSNSSEALLVDRAAGGGVKSSRYYCIVLLSQIYCSSWELITHIPSVTRKAVSCSNFEVCSSNSWSSRRLLRDNPRKQG